MPRLGLATIDISTLGGSGGAVTGIDDFVFESFSAGQMHPIQTASRTNLIPYSEDFSNAAWFKSSAISITSNYATAPDGSQTASRVVSTGGSFPQFHETLTGLNIGKTYTVSFHVKSDGTTQIQQATHITSNGGNANFTPTNDWVRIEYTRVATANSHTFVTFTPSGTASASSYLIWGFQVEEDGFISEYIPTSGSPVTVATILNDTSNVWDFDGTDIMIEEDPESEGFWEESYPEGATLPELVLNGDYEDLGSELNTNVDFDQIGSEEITNGHFTDNISGWIDYSSTSTWDNGTIKTTSSSSTAYIRQNGALTTGKQYKVTFKAKASNASQNLLIWNGTTFVDTGLSFDSANVYKEFTYYLDFSGSGGSHLIIGQASINSGDTINFDNVSVKEIGQGWENSFGSAWTFDDEKVTLPTGLDGSYLTAGTILTASKNYKAVITTSGGLDSSNKITLYAANNTGVKIESDGTHTVYFTSDNDTFRFLGVANDRPISIDSVSIKQVDPNDRWTLGTGWTISDGKANFDGGSDEAIQQSSVVTNGDTYEITFTVSGRTTGDLQLRLGNTGAVDTTVNTNTTHTNIFVSDGTSLYFRGVGGFDGSIDNVSVKEYAIQPLDI